MNIYTFIVRRSDQEFVSIIKKESNDLIHIGVDLTKYSALTTDEETARLNFTATGHLPSDAFEILMIESI